VQLLEGWNDGAVLRGTPGSWLVPFLLLCVESEGSARELRKSIDELGFRRISAREFYGTLRKMQREGLISTGWDTKVPGLPQRRYELTEAGRAYLEFWSDSLLQYRKEMDVFFELYKERSCQGGSL
jgi:poly-beta-hydroxybutyrate-responsive repressor